MSSIAIPSPTLHASLISALEAEDPESALEQAFIQLGRGANMALLLAMIKALVRVGLAGFAVRLLRSSGGLIVAQPQMAALANQLEQLPHSEVPQELMRSTLRKNIDGLRTGQPEIAAQLQDNVNATSQFRSYISRKGNWYIVRESAVGRLDFVFRPFDHHAHAASIKLPEGTLGSSLLILGVPVRPVWERLVLHGSTNDFLSPLDIVETDLDVLTLWLSLVDVADELRTGRVNLFGGDIAVAAYGDFLIQEPNRHGFTDCITSARPRWQPPILDKAFQEHVVRCATARKSKIKASLDAEYADKSACYWHDRFTSQCKTDPLRIIGFTSRFSTVIQHSMRDIASAFRKAGCDFHVVAQPNGHTAAVDIMGALVTHKPDMVFVINHLRSEMSDAFPTNLPYVCWIQDHMQALWTTAAGNSVAEFDLVLGHSPDVMTSIYKYPAGRFLPTSNLTSPEMFCARQIDTDDRVKYRCDVSYVGHGHETPAQLIDSLTGTNEGFKQYLLAALALITEKLEKNGCFTTQDLVDITLASEEASRHCPLTPQLRRSVVIPAIQRVVDRALRHQSLEWAADWAMSRNRKFKIFGNGWKNHATLGRFAAGTVEHGDPLRCVYQASSINLQINAYGALHQRLLDGIAAGGFMLSRYIPADFIRQPFDAVKAIINEIGIRDLATLMKLAENDRKLHHHLCEAEALTGTRIAPMCDERRRANVIAHIQCASLPPENFTDEGLFDLLRNGIAIPDRVASDLPNFRATTFRNQDEMHALLDHYLDREADRRALSEPMRQSVLDHDTYDQLVERVLRTFRAQWASKAEIQCAC